MYDRFKTAFLKLILLLFMKLWLKNSVPFLYYFIVQKRKVNFLKILVERNPCFWWKL